MSFDKYMLAQEETGRRRAEREAASARLELAKIKERLAEIESQHNPLAERSRDREERAKQIDCAFYVVVGRWPRND